MSAVAGRPKDSDVSVSSTSLLPYPLRVVCVAVTIGTLNSPANPLSSSAMLLIIV